MSDQETARAEAKASELGHQMEWIRSGYQRFSGNCKRCGRPALIIGRDCCGSALLVTCQKVKK